MIPYDSWHLDAASESTEESIPSIEQTNGGMHEDDAVRSSSRLFGDLFVLDRTVMNREPQVAF